MDDFAPDSSDMNSALCIQPEPDWPSDLSAISPDGLLESFHRHLDPGIAAIRVSSLRGDASTRRYYRASISGSGVSSAILMALPEPCPARPEDHPFLNIRSFLSREGLPVPGHYFTLPERGIIVLEDFGDLTLESGLPPADPSRRETWYLDAIDSLVKMQTARGTCFAFTYSFTPDKFEEELLFFFRHAVEGLWNNPPSPSDRDRLLRELRRLAEKAAQPAVAGKVFTHRDYHSRNLMILPDRFRLGILDFQDARLGPRTYDLASLVYDSYVTLSPEFRGRLVDHYQARWHEKTGETLNQEALWYSLRVSAIQRNLKAIGTFAYQVHVLGRTRYFESIGPTLRYLPVHFERIPEFSKLWSVLRPLLPNDPPRNPPERNEACFG